MWHVFKISPFRGDKPITSLPVFPSWCLDSSDGGSVKERLSNLGEKYYKILRNIPSHQYYQGVCWDLEAMRVERSDGTIGGISRSRRMQKPDMVNFNDVALYCFLTIQQEYTGEIIIDWSLLKPKRRLHLRRESWIYYTRYSRGRVLQQRVRGGKEPRFHKFGS